ncbi:hypothetical protein [Pedobacter sp. SYSU D00535]|uniref:hypothetical protein n=1 Tax=Pedobacter sp. SYSU D00535 TaxID=2810308 RepID=UPI001A9639ED|nr:hypothetical protein [Pedobacter sp. SYSU D00535]
MKHFLQTLSIACLLTGAAYAQAPSTDYPPTNTVKAPQGITYQAVARNGNGGLLANQMVSVRFTIKTGPNSFDAPLYQEVQSAMTNKLGLFTVNVGSGNAAYGFFPGINWGDGPKFVQVEIDPNGGNNYVDMGTNQMMSVPYALYAERSGNAEVADGSITAPKIAYGSVDGSKVAYSAISEFHISGNAVTAQKISPSSIHGYHLNSNTITSNHLDYSAVTSDKISDRAVTPEKISDRAVTSEKIGFHTITPENINFIDAQQIRGAIRQEQVAYYVEAVEPYNLQHVGDAYEYTVHPEQLGRTLLFNIAELGSTSSSNSTESNFTDPNMMTTKIRIKLPGLGNPNVAINSFSTSDFESKEMQRNTLKIGYLGLHDHVNLIVECTTEGTNWAPIYPMKGNSASRVTVSPTSMLYFDFGRNVWYELSGR